MSEWSKNMTTLTIRVAELQQENRKLRDQARAINVDLAMTILANEDASTDWLDGFEFARKRVKAILEEGE